MADVLIANDFILSGVSYQPCPATMPATGMVSITFQTQAPGAPRHEVISAGETTRLTLTTRYGEQIVPGSVNFTCGGKRYFDRQGMLYNGLEVATGAATLAGSINYSTGEINLTDWTPGTLPLVKVDALLTTAGDQTVASCVFRIPVSPIRPGSLQILATKAQGGSINVTAGLDGAITGAGVQGTVDYGSGVVQLSLGDWVTAAGNEAQPWYDPGLVADGKIWRPGAVFADTVRFNAVGYTYLPLDANLLGLDPVRLPSDGRVPIFSVGDYAVLGHRKAVTATVTAGQVIDCGRVRLSRVRIIGADGMVIDSGYRADLDAGTVTVDDPGGWAQPVTVEDRIEDMLRIADVQISGRVAFVSPATHAYPAGQAHLSSALMSGTLKSRVSAQFAQQTWGNTWSDALTGSASTGKYDDIHYPIAVTNLGAVTERWALVFTNSTTFNLVGEHLGQIVTGASINVDLAPVNPATNAPYFTLKAAGFGSGWAAGNAIRINTAGALFPLWCIRTVQMGAPSVTDDRWTLLVRGDVDRPAGPLSV